MFWLIAGIVILALFGLWIKGPSKPPTPINKKAPPTSQNLVLAHPSEPKLPNPNTLTATAELPDLDA